MSSKESEMDPLLPLRAEEGKLRFPEDDLEGKLCLLGAHLNSRRLAGNGFKPKKEGPLGRP